MKITFSLCLAAAALVSLTEAYASTLWFECTMLERNSQKITRDRDGLGWPFFSKDQMTLKTESFLAQVFPMLGDDPMYFNLELHEEGSHKPMRYRLDERVNTLPLGPGRVVTITCDVSA